MSESSTPPRGVRNNNPGNIRRSTRAPVWKEEIWPGNDDAFCTFSAPEWGIRAIVLTLISYHEKDGCQNIAQAIRRWAPPQENQTASYVAFVAGRTRIQAYEAFDTRSWRIMSDLVAAIIAEECADYVYPSAILAKGLMHAGLMPTPPADQAAPDIRPAPPVQLPPPDSVTADDLNRAELENPGAPLAALKTS
jgi:hypothetical protein